MFLPVTSGLTQDSMLYFPRFSHKGYFEFCPLGYFESLLSCGEYPWWGWNILAYMTSRNKLVVVDRWCPAPPNSPNPTPLYTHTCISEQHAPPVSSHCCCSSSVVHTRAFSSLVQQTKRDRGRDGVLLLHDTPISGSTEDLRSPLISITPWLAEESLPSHMN